MTYGLTDDGFVIKRLQTIKTEIEQSFRDTFGSINIGSASVFGQIIGVMSKVAADIWEQVESVYYARYPESADGVSLDNAVTLTGITRLGSTESTGVVGLGGTAGTMVPTLSQVSVETAGDIFEIDSDIEIQNSSIESIFVNVVTVADSTTYTVTIDTVDYAISSGVGATAISIATALVTEINATATTVTCTDYLNGSFIVEKVSSNFDLSVDSNLEWLTPANVTAITKGSTSAPQNSLNVIETPISGWDSVNNFQDITEGRDPETDAALRLRRLQSLQISSAATPEAIRSRIIQNVDGVLDAFVIENETDITDVDGRPPHSFETIVSGGDDQDIIDEIWALKPAGIQTYGSDSGTAVDSQGNSHTIYFSRPTEIPIYIDIVITLNPEETYPDDGDDQIVTNIVDYFDTLQIGDDVLYQKLFGIIYQVAGISSVDLKIATTPSPTGTANIAMSATEIATTSSSYISVVS